MAHLLAKFGKQALTPTKVGQVWYKAAISPKNIARLKKEWLAEGKVWEFDPPAKEVKPPRPPKGHKHDRLKAKKEEERAAKMAAMPERIAEYRRKRREINASVLDQLILTKKQIRLKQRSS